MRKTKIVSLLIVIALLMVLPVDASEQSSKASILFSAGSLTLDQVPEIDFGVHTIAGRTASHSAYTIKDCATIRDARGSMSGWSLKVNLSNFYESGKLTLQGTSMIIEPSVPYTYDSGGKVPTGVHQSVELLSGDNINHTLVEAEKGEGSGIWNVDLETQNVHLHVPGGTAKPKFYQATMKWTITDAPDS